MMRLRLGIAVWFVKDFENKVLLQVNTLPRLGIEIHEPLKTWIGNTERTRDGVIRLVSDKFGRTFSRHYHFGNLREITTISFDMRNGNKGMRHHFAGPIQEQQVELIKPGAKISFLGEENLSKIRKLGDTNLDPTKNIVLYEDDREILSKILGVEGE